MSAMISGAETMSIRLVMHPARPRLRPRLALLLLLAATGPASADEPTPEQRADFLSAERALASGDRVLYQALLPGLRDYPLYPYLQLAELTGRLQSASADEVMGFLTRYRGTAPGERLRLQWLKQLAREGRWQAYVDAYLDNGSETRQCTYRRALFATGRVDAAFDGLGALYLTGKSLPDVCDPLLGAWAEHGGLTADLVWQRVDLALARGNTGTAKFQRRYLPTTQRPWLDQLLSVHERPHELTELVLPPDPRRRAATLAYGLERLARRDPAQAAALWQRLQPVEPLAEAALDRIHRAIGAGFARDGDRRALDYFRRIEARPDNLDTQVERLRAALQLRAWADLAVWIEQLPADADPDGEWQYWRARALARAGDLIGAAHAFERASSARSFWGFRAAELLGRPPALEHRAAPIDEAQLSSLQTSPTSARIRELERLGRDVDVAREWRELTRAMTPPELITASALAARLGLTTESIFTLARADYWDDLELRFPMPHRRLTAVVAAQHGLPEDWLYAVMRQESAFDADIASHAGAVGLMQLMPATAAEVALDAGLPAPSRLDLTDPALNLELGSRYLVAMRRRFGGNTMLATAAYNAGPGAVGRWLPAEPVSADLWMAGIPYRETRDYVRRVLTYRVIYAERLGRNGFRLGALLRPVAAPGLDAPRGSGAALALARASSKR
jgi:soluble lytic murein transglycosylase